MGIFGNYYNRPGPGIRKDAPKKKGVALYFELFTRHFWDFCKENMLYALASLPMIAVLYIGYTIFDVFSLADADFLTAEIVKAFVIIITIILCGSGPASASMAYMMRCVTREEHCFLWEDFANKFKHNFKNSIILSVLDAVLLIFILPVAANFYHFNYMQTGNVLLFVMFVLILVMGLVYIMAHIYFYQFAITFENNFKDTFKNSVIIALTNLPMSIVLILIPTIVTYVFVSLVQVTYVWIITVVCWFAAMRYPLEFYASRIIAKKLLDNKE